ncbi:HERC1, partial [Symbiodinium necroappetens]
MSVQVTVSLLSGKTVSIDVDSTSSVGELRKDAQSQLGIGSSRLMRAGPEELRHAMTVQEAGLVNGDELQLIRKQLEISSRRGSAGFALLKSDGSVVTWGGRFGASDSSAVQGQLQNVQKVQASCASFAALLDDGSVVTWGRAVDGGDSSQVQHQLKGVRKIQAFDCAFAAIRDDGFVVTWGDPSVGGDSSHVQHQLKDVRQIQASLHALAALLGDGSV